MGITAVFGFYDCQRWDFEQKIHKYNTGIYFTLYFYGTIKQSYKINKRVWFGRLARHNLNKRKGVYENG